MPEVTLLDIAVDYIRKKVEDAFIITQFAVLPDAHTSTGISATELITSATNMDVDVVGFNCGSGPSHMLRHIKHIKNITDKPLSALPNASFPSRVGNRTFYVDNENYFADIAIDILSEGVRIIGGCCGTTPGHIRRIRDAIDHGIETKTKKISKKYESNRSAKAPDIDLLVEISPPLKSSTKSMVNKINTLKDMGIKTVTLPDSPLGRSRMNPVIISSYIRKECMVDTIAHLCCRDRNITAVRSDVLASWVMGLRKILCITGDPVAAGNRDDIKSVFNLTSIRLMEMISHMNRELFSGSPIEIYGAVDFSVPNFSAVINRTNRKLKAGATALLSQPIFSDYAIENIKKLKQEVDIKVYAGIMPPVSYRNAKFLNNEVPGIRLPDELIEALKKADEDTEQQLGVRYAVDIGKKALQYADGLYLMLPFGKVNVAAEFFEYFSK
jgi:homocysteine S-methyltransferase